MGTDGEGTILRGHASPICGAEFSPRGDRIATRDEEGSIRLWTGDGSLRAVLRSPPEESGIEFSTDGRFIRLDRHRVWCVYDRELLKLVDSRITRDFTAEERRRYAGLLRLRPEDGVK